MIAMNRAIDEENRYISLIEQTKILVHLLSTFVLGEMTGYSVEKPNNRVELTFHKYAIEAVTYGDGVWELYHVTSSHKVLYSKMESPSDFANFLEGFLLGYECRKNNSLGGTPPSLPME